MNKLTEKLIQKYLKRKTSRDEERVLLNICLKDIGMILEKYNQLKIMKENNMVVLK